MPAKRPKAAQEAAPRVDPFEGTKLVVEASMLADRLNLWRLNASTPTYFGPVDHGKDWREMGERDLRRWLKKEGVKMKADEGQRLSECEHILEHICNKRLIDFAGPLAGHNAGVHRLANGRPFIALGGPTLVVPEEGDWSLIKEILTPRFADPEDSNSPQLDLFLLWLKRGVEPLYEGRRRKGPMLILAGPNDTGKSFIQHHIITPIFGGREHDPTDFFKSEQGFNRGMMASEHLAIGEFAFPLDSASRLMLSEKMKKVVANDSQTYHPKGRDSMTMHPHFRLSISINDNPEKLRALPPMNNDLADKVVLLKVQGGKPMPMATDSDEEEAAFAAAVRAQLPAFAHFLLSWTPPEDLAQGRFGMKAWQHPAIIDALWEQEPVSRFAFLLDRNKWPAAEKAVWEAWGWVKSVEINEELASMPGAPFRTLLKYEGACAQMLGMLHKRETEELARARNVRAADVDSEDPARRYAKRHAFDGNHWQLRPPPKVV